MSDEQLEYSAKLLADNISLEKRVKEIYEGFIATTQELCETTKEIERLHTIIKEVREYIEHAQNYGKEKILYINGNDILEILDKGENNE